MRKIIPLLFLIGLAGTATAQFDELLPVPQHVKPGKGRFRLGPNFRVVLRESTPSRIRPGANRWLTRLDGRTGLNLPDTAATQGFPGDGLNIWVRTRAALALHDDESYVLKITPRRIMLEAETDLGALHGLETLLQLLSADASGYYFPAGKIEDAPRFPWRGLLIDVCRHWQPAAVIKRNLDGMAAMKLNVLHWHLSEDQGFRIESRRYPKLHEKGSNGHYFTQHEVRDIIAYADARGIRVVPEFDLPGHATAWFVGHPELASAPGPYTIETGFGVFDPAMDPTREEVYTFLDTFLTEMCDLFPDAYFHIGGDENNGKHWNANPKIQAFMQENDLADNHALQQYFNQRLLKILEKNGKRMMGWDEILQPGIPRNIVIQSWRGREALVQAATQGYDVLLSNGYYIDLGKPAAEHYRNDPLPAGSQLDAEARKHVLGGEATMWGELISPETIDSRIWPRTCAIAERLWSAASVKDVSDLYRRLEGASLWLEMDGLRHRSNREIMMRRAAGSTAIQPLATLLDVVEPLKIYQRHHQGIPYSTALPLTRIPDMAIPDAPVARRFRTAMEDYLREPDEPGRIVLTLWLRSWRDNHAAYLELCESAPLLREGIPLSLRLKSLAVVGLELLEMHAAGTPVAEKETVIARTIANAREPSAESELAVVEAFEMLYRTVYAP
ncbi:MAG: family 20 glycosylhydrolase [Bacteroidota bacterium]